MLMHLFQLAPISLLWLVGSLGAVAQDPPPVDPCACKVVNHAFPGPAPCKCQMPGDPDKTASFSVSEETFPDGLPSDGKCSTSPCNPVVATPCTLKPMQVIVTIMACARQCTKHDPSVNVVPWKWSGVDAFGVNMPNPMSGSQAIGTSFAFTLHPPADSGVTAECGSGDKDATLTFLNKDATTAFTVTFRFGCGKCSAGS